MENNLQAMESIDTLKADPLSWWRAFLSQGAFFRTPKGELWLWVKKNELCSQHHSSNTISYMHFFDKRMRPFGHELQCHAVNLHEFIEYLSIQIKEEQKRVKDLSPPKLMQKDFSTKGSASFEKSFNMLYEKIKQGDIEKAVPVISTKTKKVPSALDKLTWIKATLESSGHFWSYGLWGMGDKKDEGVIGATPELLFSLSPDGLLKTMALAGTLPKNEIQNRHALLRDKKELLEHSFVVEALHAKLKSLGQVQYQKPTVIELPTLFHLQTLFELRIREQNLSCDALVQLLHPTAALGVFPQKRGWRWLVELPDQSARKIHGAPLCFNIEGKQICLVAIRNIQWSTQGSVIFAGCGIVLGSELEREWRELEEKINAVFNVLGIE